jgi:hypothetical protein
VFDSHGGFPRPLSRPAASLHLLLSGMLIAVFTGEPGFVLHGLPETTKMLSWFELFVFLAVWVAIQVWLLPRLGVPT